MANWVLEANGNKLVFDGDERLEIVIDAFLEDFPDTEIADISVDREGEERPECKECQYGRIEGERWDMQKCQQCKVFCPALEFLD